MYKVTIQTTPVDENNWKVVANGSWTPGLPPELDNQTLPLGVIEALFNIIPSEKDMSGRNQVQEGDTFYAVVFRRLSSHNRRTAFRAQHPKTAEE